MQFRDAQENGPLTILSQLRIDMRTSQIDIVSDLFHLQFQEELGIEALNSTLHLTFRGQGVSPLVNLGVENHLFDMQAVLVGEYVERPITVSHW